MFCQRTCGLWPCQQFSCLQDSAVLGRFQFLVVLLIKLTSTPYCVPEGLPWLSLLNQHYLLMYGKTYNTEDSIGSDDSSPLSVVFVLYIVSAISSHFKPLGICA